MESLPSLLARRAALRSRARCAARAYVEAAVEARRAWHEARRSSDVRDQEPYHAAYLSMAAKKDMFCATLTELADAGDESYRSLHAETVTAVREGCRAVDERRQRPWEDDGVGVDQAPGWAFGGGQRDA